MMEKIIISIGIISIGYSLFQFIRINKTYEIMSKWISDGDERLYKYSFDEMCDTSRRNWYGLKFPNEKDYK